MPLYIAPAVKEYTIGKYFYRKVNTWHAAEFCYTNIIGQISQVLMALLQHDAKVLSSSIGRFHIFDGSLRGYVCA